MVFLNATDPWYSFHTDCTQWKLLSLSQKWGLEWGSGKALMSENTVKKSTSAEKELRIQANTQINAYILQKHTYPAISRT